MLRCEVTVSPEAERDLTEIAAWYETQGGGGLAVRFVASFENLVGGLETRSVQGHPRKFRSGGLVGLRSAAMPPPFSVNLAFFKTTPEGKGIRILRVLHGMRDLPPLLEGGA
jgi:plasmid stabilization system protein ParE